MGELLAGRAGATLLQICGFGKIESRCLVLRAVAFRGLLGSFSQGLGSGLRRSPRAVVGRTRPFGALFGRLENTKVWIFLICLILMQLIKGV